MGDDCAVTRVPARVALLRARAAVLQVFEAYQRDRVKFVQTVAELATRPQARTA